MKAILKAGPLCAESGTKTQGFMAVPGTDLQLPVTLINGTRPGKTVVITGGIHGGEYPGVETTIRLAAQTSPEELSGQLIVVHPVNVHAFLAKVQYLVPEDGRNLNRVFPGKATGTVSERIAHALTTELFAQADFYMDLHGGDIHESLVPFVIYPVGASAEVNRASEVGAALMGIRHIVGSVSATGSFGSAAMAGVPGFLAEIGQCGRWSEEEVLVYLKGVRNVLKHLGLLEGASEDLGPVVKSPGMIGIEAGQAGCWYPAVKAGATVARGQKLGEIRDFFANTLGEYFAAQDGLVLYVVSSLAINAGDPLAAIV
jgi:predicted deacylase